MERNFYTTSSCGVCGKASLDAVRVKSRHSPDGDPVRVPMEMLAELPDALRRRQQVFDRTGGLHAAGLFTAEGELLVVREDVGRHNAVDKVIGWALLQGRIPARGCVLIVSGRTSFELAQKAVMAGVPVLGAVSAPSLLAVELAEECGLTLVGFIRNGSMNVYAHSERIAVPAGAFNADSVGYGRWRSSLRRIPPRTGRWLSSPRHHYGPGHGRVDRAQIGVPAGLGEGVLVGVPLLHGSRPQRSAGGGW